jgi:hypothetical protein
MAHLREKSTYGLYKLPRLTGYSNFEHIVFYQNYIHTFHHQDMNGDQIRA